MWFHAKSHLSIWRAMIWPGAMASFVPCISLHLLKQREQRCFTGPLTNKRPAVLCCKGPACVFTICSKPEVPPEKHAPWQGENNLQGLCLVPLHGTVFLIQTESKKSDKSCSWLAVSLPSPHSLPSNRAYELRARIGATLLHFNTPCGQTQDCGVAT